MARGNRGHIWTERYLDGLYRNRVLLNSLFFLLTLGAIFLITRMELRPSFSELLSDDLPSVQNLKKVTERIGGTGVLLIAVESPHFEANQRFVRDLATKLETLPREQVRLVEYNFSPTIQFFEKYGLHFLKEHQLEKLQSRIEQEIDKKKSNTFSSFLGLDDDESEADRNLEGARRGMGFQDLLPKEFDPNMKRMIEFPDGYMASDSGELLVIRVLPSGSSLGVGSARALVAKINAFVQELNPVSYDPQLKIGYGGNVQRGIEEFETIQSDILDTSILLIGLILFVLFLFFWSARWIVLLTAGLLVGVSWTIGLTEIVIGYLNTQTAFLSSLVAGTGVNYGIILLSRYLEERRRSVSPRDAIVAAVESTAIATLLASSTTAVSFGSLLVADNRGLSQFGFIGCIGVLLCWTVAFLVLPLWIYQWEKMRPLKKYEHPFAKYFKKHVVDFGKLLIRATPLLIAIMMTFSVLGLYGFRKLLKDPFEYDFTKLQNRISLEKGSSQINARIRDEVLKGSQSLNIILAETPEEAQETCSSVHRIVDQLPEEKRVFESCLTIWDLVPVTEKGEAGRRERKLRAEIKDLLGHRLLKFSDPKLASVLKRIHQTASLDPPRFRDLPPQLVKRFEEKDGTIGLFGIIMPDSKKPLEDARNLFNYTQAFSKISLPKTHAVLSAAGDPWVLSDLLESIRSDGPRISLLSFAGVILLTFLLTRSWKGGLLMALCLIAATWWQLCIQGMLGIKFNFFNFIALPITFGIGVDYPINVYIRSRQNTYSHFGQVLSSTGVAVLLCSLTTIVSYWTLLGASNQALVSFARLAMIGEFTCLTGALILLPVALRMLGKFSRDLVE